MSDQTPATNPVNSKSSKVSNTGWLAIVFGTLIVLLIAVGFLYVKQSDPTAPGDVPSIEVLGGGPAGLATNEEVRSAYNVDIIDNPNFTGKDMLKVNDEKLAEFCVRPTVKEVADKAPLDCKVA